MSEQNAEKVEWKRGDVLGGRPDIPMRDRCYYWRDGSGTWHPFPDAPCDENDQRMRTDAEMDAIVADGRLIRYPVTLSLPSAKPTHD